jgi:hypothetical protein
MPRRGMNDMRLVRKVELGCGILTGALGLYVPLSIVRANFAPPRRLDQESVIEMLLIFVLPGLLVTIGSYSHAVKERSWGRKLLWVIGIILAAMSPLLFLLGGYGGGVRQAFLVITPTLAAIATLVASSDWRGLK